MQIMIDVPTLGFAPSGQVFEQQLDRRTTRLVHGTNSDIVPLPGCREVREVRVGGVLVEEVRIDEYPLDGSDRPRHIGVKRRQWARILGVDGTPLLQRASCSNNGVWQPGAPIFVTGEWDEAISPPSDEPLTAEQPQRSVVTEIGPPAADTATRGRGRGGTAVAPVAEGGEGAKE